VSATLEERARGAIHVTLQSRGFRQVGTRGGSPLYKGSIKSGSLSVLIELLVLDPLLITPPRVQILDDAISARIDAHVDTDGALCYATTAFEEYDIYDGGGAILRCLSNVETTLALVLHGNPIADQYREFISYWKPVLTLKSDLPPDFTGLANLYRRANENDAPLVATTRTVAAWSRLTLSPARSPVRILRTITPLVLTDEKRPGDSLSSFRSWIAEFISLDDLAYVDASDVVDGGIVAIIAPNGAIAVQFEWPVIEAKAFRKAPPRRRRAWIERHPEQMTLKRHSLKSVAYLDLVNARLADPSPLANKKVGVIGAGAIGGRLALDLVKCGAGGPDNPLCLIDPDNLSEENLGRHVLGLADVGKAKVEALALEAKRFHPSVTVTAVRKNVLDCLPSLEKFDLLIDATGNNPLALKLNDHAIQVRRERGFPPIIHSAVHGNGLAVQTILVTDFEHACLKCLRPGHGEFKANPLKPGTHTQMVTATCGDGAHIPYAATAPAMAAALSLQAVLEWAEKPENPGPRVRTRRLSPDATIPFKDRSWGPDSECPACRSTFSDGAA
jgi:molybdopterin/thiamine biosynthesis adenylyltransferase